MPSELACPEAQVGLADRRVHRINPLGQSQLEPCQQRPYSPCQGPPFFCFRLDFREPILVPRHRVGIEDVPF